MLRIFRPRRSSPISDGIVELKAQAVGVVFEKLAMSNARIRSKMTAQRADHQMLIGFPRFLGGDPRAVAANVDGLGHLEIAAIGERQTNEHPLRDAFFGALT